MKLPNSHGLSWYYITAKKHIHLKILCNHKMCNNVYYLQIHGKSVIINEMESCKHEDVAECLVGAERQAVGKLLL